MSVCAKYGLFVIIRIAFLEVCNFFLNFIPIVVSHNLGVIE